MRNLMLALAATGLFPIGAAGAQAVKPVEANVVEKNGRVIGKVRLYEGPTGVLLVLSLRGLEPGWHGAHFHEVGDCSSGFKKAGGHILQAAPGSHPHDHVATAHHLHNLAFGLLNPKTNDAGALPNIYVGKDRTAVVELYTTFVSLRGRGDRPALLDSDGSSLIIHEGPEDQMGVAATVGERAACAAIR